MWFKEQFKLDCDGTVFLLEAKDTTQSITERCLQYSCDQCNQVCIFMVPCRCLIYISITPQPRPEVLIL